MFTVSGIKKDLFVSVKLLVQLGVSSVERILHLPVWKTDQWLINSLILVQLTNWIWVCWIVLSISSPTLNLSITLLLKVFFPVVLHNQITFWCSSGVSNVKGFYCHLLPCRDSLNTFLVQHIWRASPFSLSLLATLHMLMFLGRSWSVECCLTHFLL